ncbi:cellulase family glycosylhydrolase [bacterium]|nr:cellulase family glycosylhydrolase [bacterium]
MRGRLAITFLSILFVSSIYAQPGPFVRTEGRNLVLGDTGQQVFLRGMGMGNYVYDGVTDPDTLLMYHDSTDFARLASYGITSVRFYMRSNTFEVAPYTYSDEAFDWLRTSARWAGEQGIHLIPVMMAIPGSVVGDPSGFWNSPDNMARLKALWAELASRFAEEPAIAGYDLLNEPTPNSPEQWINYAQELVDTIRVHDPNHMIVLEPIYGVRGPWDGDYDNPDDTWFLVDDDNTLYDVHFYRPHEYALYYFYAPDPPDWPDPRPLHMPHDARWQVGTTSNPSPPQGDTPWNWYEGNYFIVDDPDLAIGSVTLMSGHHPGRVWFDDILVTHHDSNGTLLDTVYYEPIESTNDWLYAYQSYGATITSSDTTGYGDDFSLMVEGANGYGGWSSRGARFEVEQGEVYRASGAMMAEGVPDTGFALIRLDLYSNPSGSGLITWDRGYLEAEMDRWVQFGVDNNLPINIGEFGADRDLFQGHGGQQWLEELLDVMIERDLHFTMHLYDVYHNMTDVFEIIGAALLEQGVGDPRRSPLPQRITLSSYPNPTNGKALLTLQLPRSGMLQIDLFNLLGQRIAPLQTGYFQAGQHQLPVSFDQLSSGVYLLRVEDGQGTRAVRRVMLLK